MHVQLLQQRLRAVGLLHHQAVRRLRELGRVVWLRPHLQRCDERSAGEARWSGSAVCGIRGRMGLWCVCVCLCVCVRAVRVKRHPSDCRSSTTYTHTAVLNATCRHQRVHTRHTPVRISGDVRQHRRVLSMPVPLRHPRQLWAQLQPYVPPPPRCNIT